jgi:CRP-like cAMP-binding protein
MSHVTAHPSLLLAEDHGQTRAGGNLLAALDGPEQDRLLAVATPCRFKAGETVFSQGDHHCGIYIIRSGQVRIYYAGPSGREITLAYWSAGSFVGGPELFGGSPHMWSGQAVRPTELLHVPGDALRRLVEGHPRFALALLDAAVHKGKCFSALIQMLGTRSAAQRLAQLLVLMAELDGVRKADGSVVVARSLTQDELAKMVGATRQWVSATLDRFRDGGLVDFGPNRIRIQDLEALRAQGG